MSRVVNSGSATLPQRQRRYFWLKVAVMVARYFFSCFLALFATATFKKRETIFPLFISLKAVSRPSEIGNRPHASLPPRHFSLKPASCCIGFFVVTIPRQSSGSAIAVARYF